uniref:(northern house mosquito) hypothetical protein n=1 Tax=Culex pipiens TaxID=7175 RepID=A0A8D8IPV6_CULPI
MPVSGTWTERQTVRPTAKRRKPSRCPWPRCKAAWNPERTGRASTNRTRRREKAPEPHSSNLPRKNRKPAARNWWTKPMQMWCREVATWQIAPPTRATPSAGSGWSR